MLADLAVSDPAAFGEIAEQAKAALRPSPGVRRVITSAANARLKLSAGSRRRQREKLGLFVGEGEDLVDAARAAGIEPVELLVAGEDVEPELLAEVSTLAHPPRVIAVYRRADLPPVEPRPVALALWHVADPGNVGTLIRDRRRVRRVRSRSRDGCADPTGPKALRASAGAIFRVPIGALRRGAGPAGRARRATAASRCASVDLGGETDVRPRRRARGAPGRRRRRVRRAATIPIAESAESLNVAAGRRDRALRVAPAAYSHRRHRPRHLHLRRRRRSRRRSRRTGGVSAEPNPDERSLIPSEVAPEPRSPSGVIQ